LKKKLPQNRVLHVPANALESLQRLQENAFVRYNVDASSEL
jgi:hypothetical protein